MQVIFVGGASGVGASCLAVEIAGQWMIVDAGVRVDRKSDPLPDLALLEGKDIRAIFVTHAHADHIGALPLVHQAFPTAPIFASRATGLLMEVMLADALKIMNRRAAEEMEIPLYPPELVGSMLNQVRPLPVGETLTLPQLPGVSISASRAGHIAGAVSFGFSGSDGTLVVSGDISSTPQRTVLGALPPSVERCDLLVLESTYGARLHPNRQGEEQRLAQAVAESIARGGHTLIPCFGLGRGQELLLVLQAAQEKGQIPISQSMSMAWSGASAIPICSSRKPCPRSYSARSARATCPLPDAMSLLCAMSASASASWPALLPVSSVVQAC